MNNVIVRIGKTKKTITVRNNSKIKIENKEFSYELIHLQNSTYLLNIKDKFFKINYLENNGDEYILSINGKKIITSPKSQLREKAEELVDKKSLNSNAKLIKAPMPGMVLDIKVKVGEKVKKGETLIILEAMKMENSIKSPFDGIINKIYVEKNRPAEKDSKLLLIE